MATRRSALVRIGSRLVAAAVAVAVAGDAARGQSFHLVGMAPGTTSSRVSSLSADGRTAAGTSFTADVLNPGFVWTASQGRRDFGLEAEIPPTTGAMGLSGDGTTVVGLRTNPTVSGARRAFRYRGPGTYQELVSPPTMPANSEANGVSGDGSIVVGSAFPGNAPFLDSRAFRWTPAGGMVDLGFLPNGSYSEASAISRDGSTIVGWSDAPNATAAFVWRTATGMVQLPSLPGADSTLARGVNFDGSIIVGNGGFGRGVMWRHGAIEQLLPQVGWNGVGPLAVSDDGGVVVGTGTPTVGPLVGAVWTPALGWELATDYLTRHGVVLPQGWLIREVNSISADGRTIAGWGFLPSGDLAQGFVATIPAPGALGALLGVGLLAIRRRRGCQGRRTRGAAAKPGSSSG